MEKLLILMFRFFRRYFFLFCCLMASYHAWTQLNFVNKSPYKIFVAVGYYENNAWRSKGWFSISPGEKTTPIGKLKNRYYYYYAVDEHGNIWSGQSGGAYFYYHEHDAFDTSTKCYGCNGKNFKPIDTENYDEYTMNLTFNYDGYCYDGYCLNSWGKCKWKNGDRYEGHFNDSGDINGFGKYTWKNGAYYEGEFSNCKFHGMGKLYYHNGGYFEGKYFNGKRWGEGVEYDRFGKAYLKGRWSNGELKQVYDKADIVWDSPSGNNIIVTDNQLVVKLSIKSNTEVTAWYVYLNGIEIERATKTDRHDRLLAQRMLDLRRFSFDEIPLQSPGRYENRFNIGQAYALAKPDPVGDGDESVATRIKISVNLKEGKNEIYVKVVNQGGESLSKTKTVYCQR